MPPSTKGGRDSRRAGPHGALEKAATGIAGLDAITRGGLPGGRSTVYQVGGEVLMGTMRWQQENRLRDQRERQRDDASARQLDLEQHQRELRSRLETLREELAVKDAELATLKRDEVDREDRDRQWPEALVVQRRGDADSVGTSPGGRRRSEAR